MAYYEKDHGPYGAWGKSARTQLIYIFDVNERFGVFL